MSEYISHIPVKNGSEKSFAITFGSITLLFSAFMFIKKSYTPWFLVIISFLFFTLAFLKPSVFKIPNRLWLKLGLVLGKIAIPIVMALLFYCIVFPLSLMMKIFSKSTIANAGNPRIQTYWINKEEDFSMADQL